MSGAGGYVENNNDKYYDHDLEDENQAIHLLLGVGESLLNPPATSTALVSNARWST